MRDGTILADLDSTVCDNRHRQHMIAEIKIGRSTWEQYSCRCSDDEPIEGVTWLIRLLHKEHRIVLVTGRSEIARGLTEEWLAKHHVPYDALRMRAHGDHRPNGPYKVHAIREERAAGATILGFIEDYPEAARLIRQKEPAVPVLLVNPGYPHEAPL